MYSERFFFLAQTTFSMSQTFSNPAAKTSYFVPDSVWVGDVINTFTWVLKLVESYHRDGITPFSDETIKSFHT